MPTNEILNFAETDTGTNLLTQAQYQAAADRTNGNQPGVASSKLVNKALRQASVMAAQIAQYLVTKTGLDILDNATLPANALAAIQAGFAPPISSNDLKNLSIASSVAVNALTIDLKNYAGANPSAISPVDIGFRSATAASGIFNLRSVTAAISMTVPAGATLGTVSAVASTLYIYAIDTGAGVVLGISSTLFDQGSLQSSTALSGASNSSTTLYSTVAQTNKPIRLISRVVATEATAGTWTTAPSEVSPWPFDTGSTPAGVVSPFAGASAPFGYLLCDGTAVSRTTFLRLFNAIGTAYGSGDGSTTFNLPDLRYTFIRGFGPNTSATGSGNAASNNATFTAHGFTRTGLKARLSSGILNGLAVNTDYWLIVVDANTLAFATSLANAQAGTKIAINGGNSAVIVQSQDSSIASRTALQSGGNTGANIGTYEQDAMQGHWHDWSAQIQSAAKSTDVGGTQTYIVAATDEGVRDPITDGLSGTPRTASETRPTNVMMNYIIKT